MKSKEEKLLIRSFLTPIIILSLLFQFYPFLLNIVYSLLNWNGITKSANFIGLSNFREIVTDRLFWNAIKNSFIYAMLGTGLQIVISFFLAYLVEYNSFRWKKGLRVIFIIPIVATTATMGMMMKSIFSYEGLINGLFQSLGFQNIPWLTDPKWAMVTIILVSIWKETGTLFIYWMASFQLISPSILEAAKIDGANDFYLMKHIVFPIIKPVILSITGLTFLNSLKVFDLIQVMTAGGPYFSTDVISTYIYRTAFSSSFGSPRLSYASSAVVLLMVVLVFFTFVYRVAKKVKKEQKI